MPNDDEANEHTHLLDPRVAQLSGRRASKVHAQADDEDVESVISSHVSKDELVLGATAIGERLPYNDYTTIDWLHDLVCLTRERCNVGSATLLRKKEAIPRIDLGYLSKLAHCLPIIYVLICISV
jgi:hypothetical protein